MNKSMHKPRATHAGPGGFADCRWLSWTEDTGLLFRGEGWMGEAVNLCMSVCESAHTCALGCMGTAEQVCAWTYVCTCVWMGRWRGNFCLFRCLD